MTDNERDLLRKQRMEKRTRNLDKNNKPNIAKPKKMNRRITSNKTALAVLCAVVGVILFIILIIFIFMRNNGQAVYLNDTRIGVIRTSSEGVHTSDEIFNLIVAQLASEIGTTVITEDTVSVKRVRVGRNDFVTLATVMRDIRNDMDFLLEAVAVYVDDQRIAIMLNHTSVEAVLVKIKNRYHPDHLNINTYRTHFLEVIQIERYNTEMSNVLTNEQAYIELGREVETEFVYTVVFGDSLDSIARQHGLSLEELFRLNPNSNFEADPRIWPNNRINVINKNPLLSVVTYEKHEFTEVIPKPVEYILIPGQPAAFRRVSVQGRDGERRVKAYIIRISGEEQEEREIISYEVTQEPILERIERGEG